MAQPRRRIADEVGAPDRRVLLALQDPLDAGRLAKRFSEDRVVPTLTFSREQLIQQARDERYALIVLDEPFVFDHSSDCLDQVREVSAAPIIALGDVDIDEHPALELALPATTGAATVVTHGAALIAMNRPVALPHPIRWGSLELDMRTHQARWRGQPLSLSTLQFRIMEVLVLADGAIVTTEQLSRLVWGDSAFASQGRLVKQVKRIRNLIEADPSAPRFLVRVRGIGYRLVKELEERQTT